MLAFFITLFHWFRKHPICNEAWIKLIKTYIFLNWRRVFFVLICFLLWATDIWYFKMSWVGRSDRNQTKFPVDSTVRSEVGRGHRKYPSCSKISLCLKFSVHLFLLRFCCRASQRWKPFVLNPLPPSVPRQAVCLVVMSSFLFIQDFYFVLLVNMQVQMLLWTLKLTVICIISVLRLLFFSWWANCYFSFSAVTFDPPVPMNLQY